MGIVHGPLTFARSCRPREATTGKSPAMLLAGEREAHQRRRSAAQRRVMLSCNTLLRLHTDGYWQVLS